MRKLRPQVARSLPAEERAAALAAVLEPGESVAAGLLVALHLSQRRAMLRVFLDTLSLPHQDGLLAEEADGLEPPDQAALQRAAEALRAQFPTNQVATYLNTIWLQDPERWGGLVEVALD